MDNRLQINKDDFYYKDGMVVFKESYHIKRGRCCGCGCLHCPYDKRKVGNTTLKKKSED